MIDDIQKFKLKILKDNLYQNWNNSNEYWNEEYPYDYRYSDTYLQLTFVFSTLNLDELKKLYEITKISNRNTNALNIINTINLYISSCVEYLDHEILNKEDQYFKKFKQKNCFSFERLIRNELANFKK